MENKTFLFPEKGTSHSRMKSILSEGKDNSRFLIFSITYSFFTDQTTCECKPIVSTCSAMGTTGGILGQNGNLSKILDIFQYLKKSVCLLLCSKPY